MTASAVYPAVRLAEQRGTEEGTEKTCQEWTSGRKQWSPAKRRPPEYL